jgi:two-component system, OmpR family, aerobic respiration control sensor histidine kinase ArcB
VTESFDEQRFVALLDLAGPATALELAMRLDEDLTGVASALRAAGVLQDRPAIRAQSHVLLAIAGTVGANKLFELSERLNGLARGSDGTFISDLLAEIMLLLDQLIQRVRSARSVLMSQP